MTNEVCNKNVNNTFLLAFIGELHTNFVKPMFMAIMEDTQVNNENPILL
jgi:hypothetical protein